MLQRVMGGDTIECAVVACQIWVVTIRSITIETLFYIVVGISEIQVRARQRWKRRMMLECKK